jgi:hypothetical protein
VAVRISFLLLASTLMCAQSMDDAVRGLSAKVLAHLAANEIAHLTSRNLSSMGPADAAKVEASMDRALRKRVRNPMQVDMTLTISESARGFLLVAELKRENDQIVEMAGFRVDAVASVTHPKFTIVKRIMWEQEKPILDIAMIGDQMLVLDTDGVSRWEGQQRVESASIPVNVRDPRGGLVVADAITVHVPGSICRGTLKPLELKCESGGEFISGRNTIELPDWPPSYSHAQVGEEHLFAEPDGWVHVYDGARKQVAMFGDWGSDFTMAEGCASNRILATSPNDRDSVALYEMVNHAPVRLSDPVEFPGPVIALWPATAVARNLSTGRYEAFQLTVDCGR